MTLVKSLTFSFFICQTVETSLESLQFSTRFGTNFSTKFSWKNLVQILDATQLLYSQRRTVVLKKIQSKLWFLEVMKSLLQNITVVLCSKLETSASNCDHTSNEESNFTNSIAQCLSHLHVPLCHHWHWLEWSSLNWLPPHLSYPECISHTSNLQILLKRSPNVVFPVKIFCWPLNSGIKQFIPSLTFSPDSFTCHWNWWFCTEALVLCIHSIHLSRTCPDAAASGSSSECHRLSYSLPYSSHSISSINNLSHNTKHCLGSLFHSRRHRPSPVQHFWKPRFNETPKTQHKSLNTSDSSEVASHFYPTFSTGLCLLATPLA